MRHQARGAVFIAALGVWAACSPSGDWIAQCAAAAPPPTPPAHATGTSDPRASEPEVTVRYWVAGCSAPEDLWKYRKSSTVFCDARGRTLASTSGVMNWPDYLDAGDLDSVVIAGAGLDGLRFALQWSADESFTPEHTVPQADSADSEQVRFELAGAPGWIGLVRRFRLTWTGEPRHESRIVSAWARKRR